MAEPPAPGAPEGRPSPTALLIGSYKFDKPRRVRGAPKNVVVVPRNCRKGGRRKVLKSDGEVVPPEAFVEGDLRNMRRYLENNGVNLFDSLDYRERYETGVYGDGKKDILKRVREFFAQNDGRTEFILYFSGHGDLNGSWCIPVSEVIQRTVGANSATNGITNNGGANSDPSRPSQNQPATPPPARKPTLEVAAEITPAAPAEASRRPQPTDQFYDLVTYDDIVRIWDEEKRGRTNRRLMLILDCCHSGRWVQMVNGECGRIEYNTAITEPSNEDTNRASTEPTNEDTNAGAEGGGGACGVGPPPGQEDEGNTQKQTSAGKHTSPNEETEREGSNSRDNLSAVVRRRRDICIQAACRPAEESLIARNQLSSLFTRSFIAAQSKMTFEKLCISFFDHIFVFNFPSFLCLSLRRPFTPLRSHQPPFAGIKFFDSFDDMHLQTP